MVTPPPPRPVPAVWDAAAADGALATGEAAVDAAAASLVALESHRGTTLLSTGPLAGASVRRWARTTAAPQGFTR